MTFPQAARAAYLKAIAPKQTAWWALPLRAGIGFGFLFHGYAKLSHGPENFGMILHGLGMPFPTLLAWLTTITELSGGLAIVVGALVPLAAVPMIAVLLVAIVTVHLPNGYDGIKLMGFGPDGMLRFGKPGIETDLSYIAALIALAVGGASPLSLDHLWLHKDHKDKARSMTSDPDGSYDPEVDVRRHMAAF